PISQLSLFADDASAPAVREPEFSIRESARAKRLSIRVFPRGRVEVVVPRRTRAADVQQFVSDNREWIRQSREHFARQHGHEEFALPRQVELPAIQRVFRILYVEQRDYKSVRWRQQGEDVWLTGPIADEAKCVAALRRWLAVLAKYEYQPRLLALSKLTGIDFDRMQIRAQKTCWGSRSSSGTISLNLCLLFLRPELLHYLLVHELCHGRHMNHSRRFWSLVGKYCNDYRVLDRELGDSWRDVPVWVGLV
ncbi:MAG: SprT family zinc-dependent metalloprotease, partial [Woeseia sp.]